MRAIAISFVLSFAAGFIVGKVELWLGRRRKNRAPWVGI